MNHGVRMGGCLVGAVIGTLALRTFGGLLAGGVIGLVSSELARLAYRHRAQLKFSIRDLLLVTMIVALSVGWCVDRSQWRSRVRLKGPVKIFREDRLWRAEGDVWVESRPAEVLTMSLDEARLLNPPAPAPNPPKE